MFSLAILFATVIFVFPIVFKPGVEPLTELQFGSPFSLAVQISNQSLMPITDVEYHCEVSKLTLASGSAVTDGKVLIRGAVRKIQGNHAITAHCETAYIVSAPVNTVEYQLTLTYRTYPWPQHRTSVYHIATRIGVNGQATGWKVKGS